MSASAGRVLPIHQGSYNGATTYNPLDEVLYQGSTYLCKQQSTGNVPTNTTYWQMVAQKGDTGTTAYESAVAGGYAGTEQEFYAELANFTTYADEASQAVTDAEAAADSAETARDAAEQIANTTTFTVDFSTGNLVYTNDYTYSFSVNSSTGNLEWEVVA
jgi:hypothetical protein